MKKSAHFAAEVVSTIQPVLSVVIPCYNEVETVLDLIERVRAAPAASKQIIVVDDGSTDGTRECPQRQQASDLTIIFHPFNQGKDAALATGFKAAVGQVCIVQDADLEYDPAEYPLVIGPILQGKADVVFGSRFQGGSAASPGLLLASHRQWLSHLDEQHVDGSQPE